MIVESVTFPGDHAVSADELAKRIETKPPGLFRRGLFRLDTLERDVGVLLAYLRSLGYVEAVGRPAPGPLLRRPHPGPGGDPGA